MTSPLSVMTGAQPQGLTAFIGVAHPYGVYSLNNRLSEPGIKTVLRFQDNTWDRQPDACNTQAYWTVHDPVTVARHELVEKTRFVAKRGNLNWLQLMALDPKPTWSAWYNEPVIGKGPDRFARAKWWNDLSVEGIRLMVEAGLTPCMGSFCSGEPALDTLPLFLPMLRALVACGGALDVHEYGIDGYLMLAGSRVTQAKRAAKQAFNATVAQAIKRLTLDTSGALNFRKILAALPPDAQPPIIVSECGAFSGFTDDNTVDQLEDMRQYGVEVAKDFPRVLWVSWFQLDRGAESAITLPALGVYGVLAGRIEQVISAPPPVETPLAFTGTIGAANRGALTEFVTAHNGTLVF